MGFNPEAFWKQTPRSLEAIIKSRTRDRERRLDEQAYAAYLGAALQRVNKMPRLKAVLPSTAQRKAASPQPWQRMLATAKLWSQKSL